MFMARTSEIILSKNIKLDKNYKSVLGYSESQMISLLTNPSNLVYQANNYQFIRETGVIKVSATYSACIHANYIAFQNYDYSNKWFFGFIDKVEYKGENCTYIYYTVDTFSTWHDYWTPQPCFVVREHVTNDAIGLHTVPENLETGDFYQIGSPIKINNYDGGMYICIAVSELFEEAAGVSEDVHKKNYNGIYSGLYYMICTSPQNASNILDIYAKKGQSEAIYSIFLIPKEFVYNVNIISVIVGTAEGIQFSFELFKEFNGTVNLLRDSHQQEIPYKDISINTKLYNNYTPKNNKLFTGQFNYMILSNNAGADIPLKYEDFYNNTPRFKVVGSITPGCSIKCVPINYKNNSDDNNITDTFNYGINGAKFPICSFITDSYTNWLTQNGVNIALQIAGSIISTGVGVSNGNPIAIASGVLSIANSVGSIYQHSIVPDQAQGNLNSGDVTFSSGLLVFTVSQVSIKSEYAEIIDDYFTRRGYLINSVKLPNFDHRQNYNYIQIASEECIGYPNNNNNIGVPAGEMENINNMFRNGVTIWNNHANLGNYSVSNNIVS